MSLREFTLRLAPSCHLIPWSLSLSTHYAFRVDFRRWGSSLSSTEVENTNVNHSLFLAEGPAKAKWKDPKLALQGSQGGTDASGDDFDNLKDGKGKLSPTSSHLFKLILPLGHIRANYERLNSTGSSNTIKSPPPTIFLFHPSQPLSHVSRLIISALAPATPTISFRSATPRGRTFQWSDSTDVGDFIRDAARQTEFAICIGDEGAQADEHKLQATIHVEVPTFADRTRFLRRRLSVIEQELKEMEALKRECDVEAHRGARRMAMGGLGMLVVYWCAVARLTFWDLGWDIMEPVTYLSGLTMVIIGYLWFLYQGREVSYSSVLQRSVSNRREALYKARGLDIDRWLDLVSEAKALRKEIGKIAEDYDERLWRERQEAREAEEQEQTQEAIKAEAGLADIPDADDDENHHLEKEDKDNGRR